MIGEDGEARDCEHEQEKCIYIEHPEFRRGVGEQREQQDLRLPNIIFYIAQGVVVAAIEIIGIKGGLARLEVAPDFRDGGKVAGEIVIGEEVAGAPELEGDENQDGGAQRPGEEAGERGTSRNKLPPEMHPESLAEDPARCEPELG